MNAFQPEVLEEEPEIAEAVETDEVKDEVKIKAQEQKVKVELLLKQEVVSKTLAAYIEICDLANMPQRGLGALTAYKFKCQNQETNLPITKTNVYNAALKSLANVGNFTKMEDILKYMESLNVNLDIQSYVAIFECLGRCNIHNNHLREIRIYGKEAIWKGFTFDRILNEGILLNDQREYVLSAMQAYDKDYIPKYIPPNVQYNNSLLDELNNKEQLVFNERNNVRLTGIFTKKNIKKMIEEQMRIEKNGYVTVSILIYSDLN